MHTSLFSFPLLVSTYSYVHLGVKRCKINSGICWFVEKLKINNSDLITESVTKKNLKKEAHVFPRLFLEPPSASCQFTCDFNQELIPRNQCFKTIPNSVMSVRQHCVVLTPSPPTPRPSHPNTDSPLCKCRHPERKPLQLSTRPTAASFAAPHHASRL